MCWVAARAEVDWRAARVENWAVTAVTAGLVAKAVVRAGAAVAGRAVGAVGAVARAAAVALAHWH